MTLGLPLDKHGRILQVAGEGFKVMTLREGSRSRGLLDWIVLLRLISRSY